MDFILFILKKGVVKQGLKTQGAKQIEAVFVEATLKLKDFIAKQKGVEYVQLTQFAPYAIWFDVLYEIFWCIKQANKYPKDLFKDA